MSLPQQFSIFLLVAGEPATWTIDIHVALQRLSRHDPGGAIVYFTRALRRCPVNCGGELPRLLFYMGIALRRLGLSNSAVRSWISLLRLRRDRHTRELLERFSNCYGMAKQPSSEMDDWQAFYSIQLMRYLQAARKRSLTSASERALLRELLLVYWMRLVESGSLQGKSPEEKSALFKATRIEFPAFLHDRRPDPLLRVNFANGARVQPGDPCPCGSGLPHLACCGRTPGEDELTIGLF